jgi:catalase
MTPTEHDHEHLADAHVFELSKGEKLAIRERMVAHLLNIHRDLAQEVADGTRLHEMPKAADAARPTRKDLPQSPALSILRNGPQTFAGRKVGALVTDGVDAALLKALTSALEKEGAELVLVAPEVGGVEADDGTWFDADEKLGGGPSVLFDAVTVLVSKEGAAELADEPDARDFLADAHAHKKFIGFSDDARPLFEAAGLGQRLDAGCVPLKAAKDCKSFVETCRKLRHWDRG